MQRSRLLAVFLSLVAWPAHAHAGDELRLARALDTITAAEIRADLFFFASDEMRGRDTPSVEQRVAARFVRARLEPLGFRPGAGKSFFHEYPLSSRRIDPARSGLHVTGPGGELALVFGQDYFFPSSNDIAELEREGGLVWCGAGAREEFAKVKASLEQRRQQAGEPQEDDRARPWAVCLASDLPARRRARYAEEAGVLGLIVIPDAAGTADPAPAECARTTEYALKGLNSFRADEGGRKEEGEREPVFPQAHLSLAAARRLYAALGIGAEKPALGAELSGRIRDVRSGGGAIPLENVCGFWPGADPVLAKEVIIVSAHYDHDGVKGGKVYPGADDNGSGSMGLLALAEALAEYGPMRRSVLLMWVSGEEKGLWGSAAWTKAPTLPEGHRAVCDLNIDMIGRNAPDYLLITPTRDLKAEYNGLTRLAEELAPLEGFPRLGSADEYWKRSDHMNFAVNMGIPVAFLFSDVHDDYHKPTDTPDKIDYDKAHRVVRLVLRMLDGLQADKLEL